MEDIVARPQISVRRVTPEIQRDFTALWAIARLEVGPALAVPEASESQIAAVLARDDIRAYLATMDEQPVGYIVLTCRPPCLLTDSPVVAIEQIFVTPAARRSGAARALLRAAATYADRLGAEQIASSVPSNHREANRFFTRLGFSSYLVRRVITTTALHRKLANSEEVRPELDQLLQRRRSLRARATRLATRVRS
jgi:GNAT superfamily N-acetyltransferase